MEAGRGDKIRTRDLRFWRPPLYQLSYTPARTSILPRRFLGVPGPTSPKGPSVPSKLAPVLKRFTTYLLLCLLALVMAGCNSNEVVIGGKERTKTYESVVSLAPSATEFLVVRFAASNVLKGVTDADDNPLAKNKTIVVKNTKIDAEALASVKPDLIVYDSQLWTEEALAPAKATGADMVDVNVQSLDDYIAKSFELAKKFGTEMNTSEYLDVVNTARATVKANMGDLPKPKVCILMTNNGYMVAGTKGMAADLVRNSQGDYVGPDSVRYEAVNVEWFLQNQPDIIFVLGEGADKVMADPRLAPVSAIKTKNVYNVNETALSRYVAVDRLITSFGSRMVEWAKARAN